MATGDTSQQIDEAMDLILRGAVIDEAMDMILRGAVSAARDAVAFLAAEATEDAPWQKGGTVADSNIPMKARYEALEVLELAQRILMRGAPEKRSTVSPDQVAEVLDEMVTRPLRNGAVTVTT